VSRLAPLEPDALPADARGVYDDIASWHGGTLRGPWAIEMRIPELALLSHKLYRRLCVNTALGKRLFELMVIVVARRWTSQFEFWAHEKLALENGITKDVTEAIRANRRPDFKHNDEVLIYELTTEINERTTLSPESYARALAALGEEKLIELVVGIGYYTMLAMQLNVFEADIPADARRLV
jgi:4-carboxymuconolactone decarboxylase